MCSMRVSMMDQRLFNVQLALKSKLEMLSMVVARKQCMYYPVKSSFLSTILIFVFVPRQHKITTTNTVFIVYLTASYSSTLSLRFLIMSVSLYSRYSNCF